MMQNNKSGAQIKYSPHSTQTKYIYIYIYDGQWGYFLREKQTGYETDQLLPSSVEVKNARSYTSTAP